MADGVNSYLLFFSGFSFPSSAFLCKAGDGHERTGAGDGPWLTFWSCRRLEICQTRPI